MCPSQTLSWKQKPSKPILVEGFGAFVFLNVYSSIIAQNLMCLFGAGLTWKCSLSAVVYCSFMLFMLYLNTDVASLDWKDFDDGLCLVCV